MFHRHCTAHHSVGLILIIFSFSLESFQMLQETVKAHAPISHTFPFCASGVYVGRGTQASPTGSCLLNCRSGVQVVTENICREDFGSASIIVKVQTLPHPFHSYVILIRYGANKIWGKEMPKFLFVKGAWIRKIRGGDWRGAEDHCNKHKDLAYCTERWIC